MKVSTIETRAGTSLCKTAMLLPPARAVPCPESRYQLPEAPPPPELPPPPLLPPEECELHDLSLIHI